ncbi:MAG: hypothetical protein U1E22_00375, partial [Coriobacteriia bacterium]|nr:hypothetical protein [Coriobacteriia bacterium]
MRRPRRASRAMGVLLSAMLIVAPMQSAGAVDTAVGETALRQRIDRVQSTRAARITQEEREAAAARAMLRTALVAESAKSADGRRDPPSPNRLRPHRAVAMDRG